MQSTIAKPSKSTKPGTKKRHILLLDPRILRHRQSHLDHFRDLTKMVGIYHHLLESSEIHEDDISASFSTRGASAERRKSM